MEGCAHEARKLRGSTAERLIHVFHRAGEEAVSAGPRHKELLIEVARLIQVEGTGPEQSRRLHAVFRDLLEDGSAAGELATDHDVAFLTEIEQFLQAWLSRALIAIASIARASPRTVNSSACLTTGTTRPSSVLTAMPRLISPSIT